MISNYLDMRGKSGPAGFLVSFLGAAVMAVLLDKLIYQWLHTNHHLSGLIVFISILICVFASALILTQTIRRLNDMGWHGMYSLLLVFPCAAVALLALFGVELSALMVIVLALGVLVLAPLCFIQGNG
ncbi:hypothetical protein [Cerasicoccus maritimus]|uniref:hypothetical protein n=1 Tax=Cerasicoccus maritimus TaxID=490089 RepID=UPI0028524A93|nr:hypothetical protein [Cerasicoccus maritimus]